MTTHPSRSSPTRYGHIPMQQDPSAVGPTLNVQLTPSNMTHLTPRTYLTGVVVVIGIFLKVLACGGALAFLIVGLRSIWHSPGASTDSSPTLEGFQHGSTVRGTMDIVFGCLSVICTYSFTRPDIPLLPLRQVRFWKHPLLWSWRQFVKLPSFLMTLIAPEVALVAAFTSCTAAREDVQFMHAHGCSGWTLKHSFFAQMGGFRQRTFKHRIYFYHSGRELLEDMPEQLTPTYLKEILDDIATKDKADALADALTIWLFLRFVFGVVARAADRLPIMPLEFVTCAYIPHTLMTYYFYVEKPYKVSGPIYLGTHPVHSEQRHNISQQIDLEEEGIDEVPLESLLLQNVKAAGDVYLNNMSRAALRSRYGVEFVFACVLAAGHLASWNNNFLRTQGQFWWRTFSIALVAASSAGILGRLAESYLRATTSLAQDRDAEQGQSLQEQKQESEQQDAQSIGEAPILVPLVLQMCISAICGIGTCTYIVSRIGLLVLLVYSFWSLPEGAYQVAGNEWLQFLPFIH